MKFLKIFAAALLAVVAGSAVTGILWVMVIAGLAASLEQTPAVPDSSVLVIDFAEDITDSPQTNPLSHIDVWNLAVQPSLSLYDALKAIDAACDDNRIKGIYLRNSGAGSVTAAALEELRAALDDFRSRSGKEVAAYGETFSQAGYWFATSADIIALQPQGAMTWQGLNFTVTFYKGLLDKLDLRAEIFRPTACRYKSAVEPYFLTRMSDENRRQMGALASSMWETILGDVSKARGIEPQVLDALADKLSVLLPEEALAHGFVDELLYEDEMEELLCSRWGVKRDAGGQLRSISLADYAAGVMARNAASGNVVAVIYADGDIVDGDGTEDDTVYSRRLSSQLREARLDDAVRAVVLRVNSPGGSALAADVIWREAQLLREKKPLIVSMGAYAASGGYYISAPADVIVADRLSLTGSIGVFGMMFDARGLFNNKLGITFDNVQTNPSADLGSPVRSMTPAEKAAVMRSVDKVYDTFTHLVAEGRNLPLDKVLDIAGGRVWSGAAAVEEGLADANGGLLMSIALAADKAALGNDYTVEEFTDEPEGWAALFTAVSAGLGEQIKPDAADLALRDINTLRRLCDRRGIQTYCPYAIQIE